MESIKSFLEVAKLARKQVHQNLTVFPLLAPNGIGPDYLTLEQALESDLIQVTELSTEGSAPELKLINSGEKRVLIVEGEELVGAKQNRIVNTSFLVAGKSETVIPVSCVEQGRWSYRSEKFASGDKMMHASLRRVSQRTVSESIRSGRGYRSDQGRIWDDISQKSARMRVSTPTGAMADVFDGYEDRLADFVDKFQLVEWQVGAIFAINGQILGLEAFGFYDTFKRFFQKLVKSYALDALDSFESRSDDSVPPEKARKMIESVIKAEGESHPSVGLGTNITFESGRVTGAALVEGDHMIHLSAFRKKKGERSPLVGFQRYSQRRSRR